jgi:hypothetical protein
MKTVIDNYNLYFHYIEQYLPGGFNDIDRMNQSMLKLEELTEENNQFFFVSDLIQLKIIFTSRRSVDMLGVDSKDVNPSIFYKLMHPDDLKRYNTGQTKLFNLGQQLFFEKKGCAVISSNFRFKNLSGEYINTMVQCYLFFTDVPYKTVFVLQVLTDISWFKNFMPGFHFYIGHDPSFFRYPDEYLLHMGNIFTPGNLRSLN